MPEFGVTEIKAKVDTGADNSSLHAFNIKRFERDGVRYVSFEIHPRQRKHQPSIVCEAEVVKERKDRKTSCRERV